MKILVTEAMKAEILRNSPELVNRFLRKAKVSGWICPVCGSGSGEHGTGIVLDPHSDDLHAYFTCFRCSGGDDKHARRDVIELYALSNGLDSKRDYVRIMTELGAMLGLSVDAVDKGHALDWDSAIGEPIKEKAREDIAASSLSDFTEYFQQCAERLKTSKQGRDYLAGRGISPETAEFFGIGFDSGWISPAALARGKNPPKTPRIIIPTSGHSYAARAVLPATRETKKYEKMKEGPVELFNCRILKDGLSCPIFIVEGEIDALSIAEVGQAVVGLGSLVNTGKLLTMLPVSNPLVLLLDNDDRGIAATAKLAESLREIGQKYMVATERICGNVKDANDALVADRTAFTSAVEEAAAAAMTLPEVPAPVEMKTEADADVPERYNSVQEQAKPTEEKKPMTAQRADTVRSERIQFLWKPYLPIGDFSILMAPGGSGKTVCLCGIAAAVSRGIALPGEDYEISWTDEISDDGSDIPTMPTKKPGIVLIISAEDQAFLLKQRLEASGADLRQIYILDALSSIGMDFSTNYDVFAQTIKQYNPALVVLDPWHAFLGAEVDINRVNCLRPVLQRLSGLAKECNCALILVSHVNKRSQTENANNAAVGSVDFINASRSAFQVIKDTEDQTGNCRILVHTKSNYAKIGKSYRFRIIGDGGLEWAGESPITKETLEEAAKRHSTPGELLARKTEESTAETALLDALVDAYDTRCPFDGSPDLKMSYDELAEDYGSLIWAGRQPKRALDAVKPKLEAEGFTLVTGARIWSGKSVSRGFKLMKKGERKGTDAEPEQMEVQSDSGHDSESKIVQFPSEPVKE